MSFVKKHRGSITLTALLVLLVVDPYGIAELLENFNRHQEMSCEQKKSE